MMKTMYISIFYSPVVPIGLFITIVGFSVFYWVEKYVILRKKSIKNQLSIYVSLEMTEYLEFVISIYAISNLLFKMNLSEFSPMWLIVGTIMGFVYSILPIQLIVNSIFLFRE
jgi:hypothetical protein